MKWWGWLILVVAAITVFTLGAAYAMMHAINAGRSVSKSVSGLTASLANLQGATANTDYAPLEAPSFAQPLSEVADRYADAHSAVVRRKLHSKERHAQQWRRWNA